jgi:nickel-dependent lactate racemase
MDRLNKAGVPDERIRGICALGTHHLLSLEQLRLKVGSEVASRLEGRLLCHDPHAKDNVIIGRTHRGTLVEINKYVAFADLIIGVGECMPHPIAGYGGSFKLVMPGCVPTVRWPITILPGCATPGAGSMFSTGITSMKRLWMQGAFPEWPLKSISS